MYALLATQHRSPCTPLVVLGSLHLPATDDRQTRGVHRSGPSATAGAFTHRACHAPRVAKPRSVDRATQPQSEAPPVRSSSERALRARPTTRMTWQRCVACGRDGRAAALCGAAHGAGYVSRGATDPAAAGGASDAPPWRRHVRRGWTCRPVPPHRPRAPRSRLGASLVLMRHIRRHVHRAASRWGNNATRSVEESTPARRARRYRRTDHAGPHPTHLRRVVPCAAHALRTSFNHCASTRLRAPLAWCEPPTAARDTSPVHLVASVGW